MKCVRNIWILVITRFFQGLVPAYVIERLFWEQRGITVEQVIYCEISYGIAVIALEIPTGVLADKWSRKGLLVFHAVLSCLEFLILIYATEFWHFALVCFMAGIATSARSGSESALLYDSLSMAGRQDEFEMHLGRLNAVDLAATTIAALSGGLLAGRYGFVLNYWISVGSAAVGLAATIRLVEPSTRTEAASRMGIPEYVSKSLAFLRSHHDVAHVMVTGMVLGAFITYPDEFWQVSLNQSSVPVTYFGVFFVVAYLGRILGSALTFRILKAVSHKTLLTVVTATMALGFGVMTLPGATGITALAAVSAVYGLVEPAVSGYLHHRVGSQIRATVDSFQSLGLRGVSTAVGLGFSLASRTSISRGFGLLSLLCGAYLSWLLFTRSPQQSRARGDS
ncbi:MAG: MFS transporter [Bacillota bacterium]